MALFKCCVVLLLGVASVAALDNGLALTPPMGWLTWQRFRCNTDCKNYPDTCVSERLIKEIAEAMVSEGYAAVGYEYVIIDDCWLTRERDSDGRLVADPDRFPSGMAKLADYIHSLGLKFGLYEDIGLTTCAGYPGSQDHYAIDAQTFADWNVDYVKIDGCNIDAKEFDTKYPELGRELNKTGKPILYSCEWPLYQKLSGLTPDYAAISKTCNMWRNYFDVDDYYESFKGNLQWQGDNQDDFQPFAGPGGWNDPDMVIVGDFALSVEQSKAQMAAWAVMASPLIMSNDLRNMDPQMKAILQRIDVIKINQDRLGIQGRRVFNDDNIQIWVRPVEPVVNGANSFAVAVISTRTDGALHNVDHSLDSLGIKNADAYTVTELYGAWPTLELKKTDNLKVDVPPTGVKFFKFTVKA